MPKFLQRSILLAMSAILNVLRELIAGITGEALVLFDRIIPVIDAEADRAFQMHEADRAARPLRAFRQHPPQAWAAP
ncbi:MAG: hypothetical protein DI616_20090 [Paracoccus denitrificans]|uniref:Uncharacterized protein n=2 Tax=Alphaproteobacteria TaxID=28211 RepID=A0A533HZH4_PARDE|nr:MAG: hypothetical protein DI616_20090 [Paracoccus denitrificans]